MDKIKENILMSRRKYNNLYACMFVTRLNYTVLF